jgi:hypothetical protein
MKGLKVLEYMFNASIGIRAARRLSIYLLNKCPASNNDFVRTKLKCVALTFAAQVCRTWCFELCHGVSNIAVVCRI